MDSAVKAVFESFTDVDAVQVIYTLREEIEKYGRNFGSSLQPQEMGDVYWVRLAEGLSNDDTDLFHVQGYLNLEGGSNLLVRKIGISNETELMRAACTGWVPFGFVMIQYTNGRDCGLHIEVFEWAASFPAVDAVMDQHVMEFSHA